MKDLFFDSEDPLDSWDNPNCFFNEEGDGMRREPGDPGYIPWPTPAPPLSPPTPKRSYPRPTNLPTSMQPFPYITRTGTQDQITTSPDYRGTKTAEEVIAAIQTRLGSAPPTIAAVLTTFHELIIDWCKEGWKIAPLGDLLGYRFSSGGSEDDSDFQPTFDNLKIAPVVVWGDAGRGRAEAEFSAENTGHQGRLIPVLTRVTDNWGGQVNEYTAGKSVLIELGNRKGKREFDRTNGSKVQFRKVDGTLIEASDYGEPGSSKITAQVPAGTTGALAVIVTMMINGALRSGEYSTTLTAA